MRSRCRLEPERCDRSADVALVGVQPGPELADLGIELLGALQDAGRLGVRERHRRAADCPERVLGVGLAGEPDRGFAAVAGARRGLDGREPGVDRGLDDRRCARRRQDRILARAAAGWSGAFWIAWSPWSR